MKGSFVNARLCYASAVQLHASLLPACVEALGRCCLSERRAADCIAYYKQAIAHVGEKTGEKTDAAALYRGLVAAYLAVGNLPQAKHVLAEARAADAAFAGREAEKAIRQVESGMKVVQQCMAEGAYEKCIENLRCCRSICPLWRMPFVLLLQCFVGLERGEEAYALVSEECEWVRGLEEGKEVALTTGLEEVKEVKAEIEGFDENFVYLVLLTLLQRNDMQGAVALCQLVRKKQKDVSGVLNRVLVFCEEYNESEMERTRLVSRGQYDQVEKELTALVEKAEKLREDGIHIGEKVRTNLLIVRATSRYKQYHFKEASGKEEGEG